MKKHIITLLVLIISFGAFAQKDKMKQKEKLKAFKVAHITEQLDLTAKEAEGFWPIYNAHEKEKTNSRDNLIRKKLETFSELSEEEAKALVKEMQDKEEAKVLSHRNFTKKLSKIISYKKIVLLLKAEHSFKRKMLEEFRGRRKAFRKE